MQLIVLLSQVDIVVNERDQTVVGPIHSVVHVAENEAKVGDYVRVDFLSLDAHLSNEVGHHLVSLILALRSMYKVHVDDIEEVVVESEGQLEASFVADDLADACRDIGDVYVLEHGYVRDFDEADEEHFPHGY